MTYTHKVPGESIERKEIQEIALTYDSDEEGFPKEHHQGNPGLTKEGKGKVNLQAYPGSVLILVGLSRLLSFRHYTCNFYQLPPGGSSSALRQNPLIKN